MKEKMIEAITKVYLLTQYARQVPKGVALKRPIYLAKVAGGWQGRDYHETSFTVGGSPNKARGFIVPCPDYEEPNSYYVELSTGFEFIDALVVNGEVIRYSTTQSDRSQAIVLKSRAG